MNSIYAFVSGPLVWISFISFIGGSVYRFISMARLARKKDIIVYEYTSLYYALRSNLHWIVPFGSANMRKHRWMPVLAFAFHLCLLMVPIFLLAHIVLVK